MRKSPHNFERACIKCECGEEILLVPDIMDMDRAVERHAQEHALKEKDSRKAEEIFCQVQTELVQKILIVTSNQKEESSNSITHARH